MIEVDGGIQVMPESADDPFTTLPEWLPEKFKTPADMAKAYGELERRFGGRAVPQENAPASPVGQPATTQPQDSPPVDQLGEFQKYTDEYTKTGVLAESSYAELLARGIPKALVDSYISNAQTATSTQHAAMDAQVVATIGGPQEYAAMQVWASKTFAAEEIVAYNQAMETGDAQTMLFAARGLQARYQAQAEPRLISANANTKSSGFRSMAEMTASMRDPRYSSDPAYRSDVASRIKASQLFGIQA